MIIHCWRAAPLSKNSTPLSLTPEHILIKSHSGGVPGSHKGTDRWMPAQREASTLLPLLAGSSCLNFGRPSGDTTRKGCPLRTGHCSAGGAGSSFGFHCCSRAFKLKLIYMARPPAPRPGPPLRNGIAIGMAKQKLHVTWQAESGLGRAEADLNESLNKICAPPNWPGCNRTEECTRQDVKGGWLGCCCCCCCWKGSRRIAGGPESGHQAARKRPPTLRPESGAL